MVGLATLLVPSCPIELTGGDKTGYWDGGERVREGPGTSGAFSSREGSEIDWEVAERQWQLCMKSQDPAPNLSRSGEAGEGTRGEEGSNWGLTRGFPTTFPKSLTEE